MFSWRHDTVSENTISKLLVMKPILFDTYVKHMSPDGVLSAFNIFVSPIWPAENFPVSNHLFHPGFHLRVFRICCRESHLLQQMIFIARFDASELAGKLHTVRALRWRDIRQSLL